MTRSRQLEVDEFFAKAERSRACLARVSGKNRQLICRRIAKGRVFAPLSGMYVRSEYWKSLSLEEMALHKARALQRQHPDWIFCNTTAAVAHGLEISYESMRTIHVGTKRRGPSSSSHRTVRHVLGNDGHTDVAGIRATSLDDTIFDCLRSMDFERGLAAADSYLRLTGRTRADLVELIDSHKGGYPGIRQARITAAWADGHAENGGESVARARLIGLGFMVPELQVWVENRLDPNHPYRVDFYFPLPNGTVVVGELDGSDKYSNPSMTRGASPVKVMQRERLRESRISLGGAVVMRFSYEEMMDELFFVRLLIGFGIPREHLSRPVHAHFATSRSRLSTATRMARQARLQRRVIPGFTVLTAHMER